MSAAEIRVVAQRTRALELLRALGTERRCDVALLDPDLRAVAADGRLAGLTAVADGDACRVESRRDADAAAVRVFDRVVGWVVAAPSNGTVAAGATAAVASRGADLLSELCTREFELNDLTREILGAFEELNLFYELSGDLAAATDAESIARVVVRRAAAVLGAASAWVLLVDGTGLLRPAASQGAPDCAPDVPPGAGLAGRCVASRSPDAVDDPASLPPGQLAGWETAAAGPVLTVPVGVSGGDERPPLGVLQVVRPAGGAPFTAGETKLAGALASHAAVLVENQRLIAYERELSLARTIQQSLLPRSAPKVAGLDVAGRSCAAASVGGDYFDHFAAEDGTVGLVVADVSGHDLGAALVQAAARATIRSQVLANRGPAGVLSGTNRALFEDLSRSDMYLTAWVGVADGATGRVTFCDAGHPPALHLSAAGGAVAEVSSGGVPVGVLADAAYAESSVTLAPGDVLVAYTDGLTEARPAAGGDEFGPERLAESLRRAAGLTAAEIADALLADVARFDGGGRAGDDRSVIVVKMRGPPSR